MTATIVDDLINWTLFAIILSDIAPAGQETHSLPVSMGLVLVFFVAVLGLGRWLGAGVLHWLRSHVSWPSGFISITTVAIFLAASVSEALGIHAFLGAFLMGVGLSGRKEERQEAHDVISHFALSFFAPIYFVSMGMNANFITSFDPLLVAIILVVACGSKIGAVLLGARLGGLKLGRTALAIGFGLNARGATGIILAGVGLANGVIDERIFVAIVVMAIVTSLMSGPAITALLARPQAIARQQGKLALQADPARPPD
jgi:Kef-type K+ transport system membrane component KefB